MLVHKETRSICVKHFHTYTPMCTHMHKQTHILDTHCHKPHLILNNNKAMLVRLVTVRISFSFSNTQSKGCIQFIQNSLQLPIAILAPVLHMASTSKFLLHATQPTLGVSENLSESSRRHKNITEFLLKTRSYFFALLPQGAGEAVGSHWCREPTSGATRCRQQHSTVSHVWLPLGCCNPTRHIGWGWWDNSHSLLLPWCMHDLFSAAGLNSVSITRIMGNGFNQHMDPSSWGRQGITTFLASVVSAQHSPSTFATSQFIDGQYWGPSMMTSVFLL